LVQGWRALCRHDLADAVDGTASATHVLGQIVGMKFPQPPHGLMTPSVNAAGVRPNPPPGGFFVGSEGAVIWSYLWIAVGSAIGGVLRFVCSGLIAERIGETFPWGTLVVNVSGSLVIGFFFTLSEPDGRLLVGTTARQFVMIGICGGFTTFSSFSLQTLNLARDGDWLRASANIVASVVLCLVAVWLGHIAAAAINR
jgi:fluoride exporter